MVEIMGMFEDEDSIHIVEELCSGGDLYRCVLGRRGGQHTHVHACTHRGGAVHVCARGACCTHAYVHTVAHTYTHTHDTTTSCPGAHAITDVCMHTHSPQSPPPLHTHTRATNLQQAVQGPRALHGAGGCGHHVRCAARVGALPCGGGAVQVCVCARGVCLRTGALPRSWGF